MALENAQLKSWDYVRVPINRNRKIKFKRISFKNIFARWNNFRLRMLKDKLADKKEDLVEMEFSEKQLTPGRNIEKTERKILKKTKEIAKLESKIAFLETGSYLSEEFVASRAIKLKSTMMKNLEYNSDCVYGLNAKGQAEIINEEDIKTKIDEETEKMSARVNEMIAEKKAKGTTAPHPPTNSASANAGTNNNDVTPIVSATEIAEAIGNEMDKIKVNRNESSMAKVNKFMNPDGTYRLTRYDIDEDFRITKFDRSKLPTEKNATGEGKEEISTAVRPEPEIKPFSEPKARKQLDVDGPRKALTQFDDISVMQFPVPGPVTLKDVKSQGNQKKDRDIALVVPERKPAAKQKITLKEVTNNEEQPIQVKPQVVPIESRDDEVLGTTLARVNILNAEAETIRKRNEEALEKGAKIDEMYEETYKRLVDFAEQRENECSENYKAYTDRERLTAVKQARIEAMLAIMEKGGIASEEVANSTGEKRRVR